jgi:hypothetical protein
MGRHNRLASPEGMRAHHRSRRTLRTGSLAAIVFLCACFAIAIGQQTASLTVKNLTSHTIVVALEDRTLPRVAPGAQAIYQSGVAETVRVSVSYAPGQGIDGSAQRSFYLAPYHPPVTSGTTVYFACSTGGSIVSPATGGPVTWQVTPDTLATR